MRLLSRRYAWVASLVGFGAVACSSKTVPGGGIELVIATNLTTPTDFDSITLQIQQQVGNTWASPLINQNFLVPGETTLPTTFAIAAGTSVDQTVLIQLSALKAGVAVDLREVQVQVPTTRQATLTMILAESCLGQVQTVNGQIESTCAANESCQPATGMCGADFVDSSKLPAYDGGSPGSVDASIGDFLLKDAGKEASAHDAGHDATRHEGGSDVGLDAAQDGGHDGGRDGGRDAGCGPGLTRCEEGCVDTATSSGNCGQCGIVCGGTCTAGRCISTLLADPDGGAGGGPVLLHDGRVYAFLSNQAIVWLPVAGGTTTVVEHAVGAPSGSSFTADTSHLYAGAGESIHRIAIDGGVDTTFASGAFSGVSTDGTSVCWSEQVLSNVYCAPVAGGAVTTLATGQGVYGNTVTNVEVMSGFAYWIAYSASTGYSLVKRSPTGGAAAVTLASVSPSDTVAIDVNDFYWAGLSGPGNFSIYCTSLSGGGTITTLVTESGDSPELAASVGSVYWGNSMTGTVETVDSMGETHTTLATNQGPVWAIGANSAHVYWGAGSGFPANLVFSNHTGSSIVTLAMPPEVFEAPLAADGTNVYFSANEMVGGSPYSPSTGDYFVVAEFPQPVAVPTGLAVASGSLYWSDNSAGVVATTSVTGGAPVTILAGGISQMTSALVTYDGTVYAVGRDGPSLRVPVDGGSPVLSDAGVNAVAEAVGPATFYWIGPSGVMLAPLAGGPPTRIGAATSGALALTSSFVYWTDTANGKVARSTLDGGAVSTLVTGQTSPLGIAVDTGHVFWASQAPGATQGMVMSAALDGGAVTTLVVGDSGTTSLTVDDASVYWSERVTGSIRKITPK